MRILLAHNSYEITGGADLFVHEVARILSLNGHEVVFFSPKDDAREDAWSRYCPPTAFDSNRPIWKQFYNFPSSVYSFKSKEYIRELIEVFQPDLLHCFAIYSKLSPSILTAAKDAGLPVVMTCNDYKHLCPVYKLYHHGKVCFDCDGKHFFHCVLNRCAKNSIPLSVASAIESYIHKFLRIYSKYVDRYTFSSFFMADKTKEFWQTETFSWSLLRNPFDSKSFSPSMEDRGYALFFGRLAEEKGCDILLQAMRDCPDVDLKIVGEGPAKNALVDFQEKFSLKNVEFLGPVWGDDLDNLIRGCRFVVVPSVWHENLPYVINQAFAFAKPVIGSNRGGIPELVDDSNFGLIYDADNSRMLSEKMKHLWGNPQVASQMGIKAKKYSDDNFNDSKFYSDLISIYNEVV